MMTPIGWREFLQFSDLDPQNKKNTKKKDKIMKKPFKIMFGNQCWCVLLVYLRPDVDRFKSRLTPAA